MDFSAAEKILNYTFKDKELLRRALTLSSYDFKKCNQSLEFFGDAIIEFIVSEKVFALDKDEGDLTNLRKSVVSDKSLGEVVRRLGLDKFLIKGEGDNNNKKAVPSAYEAVTAAIYLDGGLEAAKKFVLNTLDFSVREDDNFIGALQEWMQARKYTTPVYEIKSSGGGFEASVVIMEEVFTGAGETKQQAKQSAAERAIAKLKKDGKL